MLLVTFHTSLPSFLIIDLFKSDDLVTRDSETDLPTRPIDREKHILEYIINYCENTFDKSLSISSFLPCVKLPLFKIFDNEKFVFTELNLYINDVNSNKEELEKLNIEH